MFERASDIRLNKKEEELPGGIGGGTRDTAYFAVNKEEDEEDFYKLFNQMQPEIKEMKRSITIKNPGKFKLG